MARLSVNVNKVATLRNSRGGDEPNVLRAVRACHAASVMCVFECVWFGSLYFTLFWATRCT